MGGMPGMQQPGFGMNPLMGGSQQQMPFGSQNTGFGGAQGGSGFNFMSR